MKKRIGIVFGGPSGEHEVSIVSAFNIYHALNAERYDKTLIGMDKQGVWRVGAEGRPLLVTPEGADGLAPESASRAASAGSLRISPAAPAVSPRAQNGRAVLADLQTARVLEKIDVFFPIAHGTFGEDGCLQGRLRLLGVPFVGAGVLGSAAGMDKDVMKRLMREAGLPVPRFVAIRARDRDDVSFDVLSKTLGTPLFVKPCNLGSSVGIHKVSDAESFRAALEDAFRYDLKVIIEEAVAGREIECSVLGNDAPQASVAGEVVPHDEFYSYHAKYVDPNGASLEIPARLSEEKEREIRDLAVRTFEAVECLGMARVDFFLKEDGAILVNEINTLPGFTRISMYPKLWEASGIGYAELLDRLIALAVERHEAESRLKRSYGD